jgi:ribosomal protein S3
MQQNSVDLENLTNNNQDADETQSQTNNYHYLTYKILKQQFLPVLSLFNHYLQPQLLADHIAKEFERTKNHRPILYALKSILYAIPFKRGIGVSVAIQGRINSATKSRVFYIKRQPFYPQQFSSRLNFAQSQARARIGAFGIKV